GDESSEPGGSASPRVSASDAAPHRMVERDAPSAEKLAATDESVSVLASAKKAPISGLRSRLLLEAAERALHSEHPWSDLSVVALGFKRAGDEESALYWFGRAARLAGDPDDLRKSSEAMAEVAKSMVLGRYLDQARELISRIGDSRIKDRSTSELVRALANKRQFEEARALARTLDDQKAVGLAYRNVAEAEARYLSLDDARATLKLISDQKLREDALGRVAAIRAGAGDSDGAISLINEISDVRVRDVALARLAKLESSGGKVSIEALAALIKDPFFRDQALREMVASEVDRRRIKDAELAAHRIKNAEQRAKAYESLVILQLRYRDFDGALARAQSIKVGEVRRRALQAIAVAQVPYTGVKAARNIANLIGDTELREATFRKIVSRASMAGQSRLAVDTIHYMGDPSERAMAYASVAMSQANYGDDSAARRYAQDADRELVDVSSARDLAKTVGLLAEVHAQTGDSSSAFEAAASIQNSGLRDLTYQKMAVRFARSHEAELAEQSAHLIERDTTRERALDSVATTLAGGVSVKDAMSVVGDLGARRQQVRFLVAVAGRKS
ncbi:hypothetical protein N9Z02_02975, partial [Akkermansiaceae bacterium]|nr:hypothetical protein [Akkermansiaceae bacterium]